MLLSCKNTLFNSIFTLEDTSNLSVGSFFFSYYKTKLFWLGSHKLQIQKKLLSTIVGVFQQPGHSQHRSQGLGAALTWQWTGRFQNWGSSSRWVSIWSGTALSYGNLTTLLLMPGEKTWVCILWLTNNVTWTITQASDFGRMNVSKRAYIKNLAKEEPMRHKVSVVQTEVTCIDILGSPTRPTQGHLKKLVEAQGAQPAPPRHCLVQPNQEFSDSSLSSFKFQIKFT